MPTSSLKGATQKEMRARLDSLPRTEASFVEPMECLSVSKLPEGSKWIWEILCGSPHNEFLCGDERYVALTLIGDVVKRNVAEKHHII
jgi:hypothetical protein